jgi:hypothetical protein
MVEVLVMKKEAPAHANNLIQCADKRNEFDYLDDGFQYWFPTNNQGGLSSKQLRILADELDRRNYKWEQKVDKELADVIREIRITYSGAIAEELVKVQPMPSNCISNLYQVSKTEDKLRLEGYHPVDDTTKLIWTNGKTRLIVE